MLELKEIKKTFREGTTELAVLEEVSLCCKKGEKIGIVGASGCGKSTLLHIAGGLEEPSGGEVLVEGKNLYQLEDRFRSDLRNKLFGFVFQFYHLLPELTALENTALPLFISGMKKKEAQKKANILLEALGLASFVHYLPGELSGGGQQRVAIARALVADPTFLFADEPTGNLDETTAAEVFECILNATEGSVTRGDRALVLVTHNRELLSKMDRCFELKHGKLLAI